MLVWKEVHKCEQQGCAERPGPSQTGTQKWRTESQAKTAEMEKKLKMARRPVDRVMKEEGSLLDRYELPFEDIVSAHEIGQGAFGTVFKGLLRGTIDVALKTMRVGKIMLLKSNEDGLMSLYDFFWS